MNGRKAIAGLCMLCALLTSAVAAQSASAISGTTVVTCKEGAGDTGGQTFAGAHCIPGESAGKYGHYKIAQDTTTELIGRGGTEFMKLKATLGGVATTFTSTSISGSGTVENKVDPNGEHYVHAQTTGIFEGVTVSPYTKCFVYTDDGTGSPGAKGVIDTQELTTTSTGQGHFVKYTPAAGEVLARFWVLDKNKVGAGGECTIQGTYTVTGSVKGVPNGATFVFTHAATTEQNTLKIGAGASIKAGVEGSITMESREKGGGAFQPLGVTTYSTE
ncbi:MAG TPA: hypothetical protein VMS60_10565 [Solirubrobacterales bacterium]|nr:hypothetical protein [Solirubrobacterales bacterium]